MYHLIHKIKASYLERFLRKRSLLSEKNYRSVPLKFARTMKMNLFGKGDVISDNISYLKYYEWELSKEIAKIGKHSKIMVDAGANMGYFSLIFLGANPNNRVIAFEPNPKVSKIYESNIQVNNLSERAKLIKKALSDKVGILQFDFGFAEQSGWGHVNKNGNVSVDATTLDNELLSIEKIDILKIDVEGFELNVLKGAKQLIEERRIKHIFFELNEVMLKEQGTSSNVILEHLKSSGYELKRLRFDMVCAYLNN